MAHPFPSEHLEGYKKFCALLNELFQLDLADLDFGIYRALKQRRQMIEQYFAEELPKRLQEHIHALDQEALSKIEDEFKEKANKLRQLMPKAVDENGNLTPYADDLLQNAGEGGEIVQLILRIRELEDLRKQQVRSEQAINDVFLLVYDFFRRYFDEGDFIPQPRFSHGEGYALESYIDRNLVPQPEDFPGVVYRGEDVYFHWPTRGMHYVKSETYLKNYSFEVEIKDPTPRTFTVRFILDQVESVRDNNRISRYFFPKPEVRLEGHTLTIPFDYRRKQGNESITQEKILEAHLPAVLAAIPDPDLRAALEKKDKDGKSLLFRRVRHFSGLGTRDFFIHPLLEHFLQSELDYFIKAKALRQAELGDETVLRQRLVTLKAFRAIAQDLIRFLGQLERLQSLLFEKKRLVYRTDYIMPIRLVPQEFWGEILQNQEQIQYWKEDMALEEITWQTLQTHPTLPVYTGYFDRGFARRLLMALTKNQDLDEITDGVLVHAENYGALRTLEASFRELIAAVYIDPPYNSSSTEILYKNGLKHATWLSMLEERLRLGKAIAGTHAPHVVAIDENEQERLGLLLRQIFPDAKLYPVVVEHNRGGTQGMHFSFSHQYAYFVIPQTMGELPRLEASEVEWESLRKWGGDSERHTAKNCFYPIFVKEEADGSLSIEGFGEVCDDSFHPQGPNVVLGDRIAVYPIDAKGVERKWRYSRESIEKITDSLRARRVKGRIIIEKAKKTLHWKTLWSDPRYVDGDYGTGLLTKMGLSEGKKIYPKSVYTVLDSLRALPFQGKRWVLDYFGGSGTTAHAVILLNLDVKKFDNNLEDKARFLLVEMGEYFDSILLRRVMKAMFAKDWDDGRPREKYKENELSRLPRLVKVLRLESYDDALFNLGTEPSLREQTFAARLNAKERPHEFLPQENVYLLSYFAEVLQDGNPTLLRPMLNGTVLTEWHRPQEIRVRRPEPGTPGGYREEEVDWLETALLWLGLRAHKYVEIEAIGQLYRIVYASSREGSERVALILRDKKPDLDPHAERAWLEKTFPGYRVILNAPPVVDFESLEEALLNTMLEGPK